MFPPSSDMMNRVRAQAEQEELERQAQFQINAEPIRRWRLPSLLALLKRRADRQIQAERPLSTCSQFTPNDA
ncbi:MAG TPA: hypothetical protein VHD90_13755 [Phototrophicaceae bacterium]|nr:hypothetical protein [Phototrophicaceae bacterium]